MEISFVIPVYNGESCIGKCIAEICRWDQKEEIEIIIIDDGSTDGTWQLCNDEAGTDSRIKLIHIENSGQGVARNRGIRAASGRFIYFVDADDWVDVKEIHKLLIKAQEVKADVTMGGYYRIGSLKVEQVHIPGDGFIQREGTLDEIKRYHSVKTGSAFGYVWNKLYRRAFLEEHQLYMDDIRTMNMEDFLFNLKVWSKKPRFYCVDYPVYYYVTDNVSTTRRTDPYIHRKNVAMIRELIQYLNKNGVLEDNLDMVVPLVLRSFCWALIKNVPYEGCSIERLKERARIFVEDTDIKAALAAPGAVRHLCPLPSIPQRIFYAFLLYAIKKRHVNIICFVFYICYPLMKRYAAAALK